jgi:ParB-like chromosome segregation protein Spo0J
MDQLEEERIGNYRVHPVASLFPLLEGQEFEELCEDIESVGQKVPIVVHEGMLLDGRNRLRACLKLGIEPIVES